MLNYNQANIIIHSMADIISMAARRCASYQMRHENLEEIGSSDVSCRVMQMVECEQWPTDIDIDHVGYFVDKYHDELENNPSVTPIEVYNSLTKEELDRALPDIIYQGKHILSKESADFYHQAKRMFEVA